MNSDEMKQAAKLARDAGTSPDNILEVAESIRVEINEQIAFFELPPDYEELIRGVIGRMQESLMESRHILIDGGIESGVAVKMLVAALSALNVGMTKRIKLGN